MPPQKTSLWIDADPSGLVWTGLDCDDDLAILAALALASPSPSASPKAIDAEETSSTDGAINLEGLSICGGNAPLSHTIVDARKLLNHVNPSSISPTVTQNTRNVSKGIGWRSMNVAWKSFRLFNIIAPDLPNSDDAAEAIIAAANVQYQKENSFHLTVLMLGPSSNLARAIQLDSMLPSRIGHVVLMGGELTNQRMDLNFMSDRSAARTVIESVTPTTIVPIQTCGQVVATASLVQRFEDHCCPRAAACALLPKMRQQVRIMPDLVNAVVKKRLPSNGRWVPSSGLDRGFVPWDVIALVAVVYPDDFFTEWEWHRAALPPCEDGEPCDGTMIIGSGQITEPSAHEGWVRIPHRVKNGTHLLETVFMDLLCNLEGQTANPVALSLGFVGHATAIMGLALVVLIGLLTGAIRYARQAKEKKA